MILSQKPAAARNRRKSCLCWDREQGIDPAANAPRYAGVGE